MPRFLMILGLCLLLGCPSGRSGGGDDDDDSASMDDDDATSSDPHVDDADIIASITHGEDDPCPHPMGSLTLVNPLEEEVDFSVGQGPNVNGLSVLTFADHELADLEGGNPSYLGTLQPQSEFLVHVAFDCSDPVTTTTTVTGSINLVGYEIDLSIDVL
jgi:hypothetical protein